MWVCKLVVVESWIFVEVVDKRVELMVVDESVADAETFELTERIRLKSLA